MKRFACIALSASLVLAGTSTFADSWVTDPDVAWIEAGIYSEAGDLTAAGGPWSWLQGNWTMVNVPYGSNLRMEIYLLGADGSPLYGGSIDGRFFIPISPPGPGGPGGPGSEVLTLFRGAGGITVVSSTAVFIIPLESLAPDYVEAFVDIKPGSLNNPFNVRSKGKVPVAIVGTAELDVTRIDPDSVRIGGVTPVKHRVTDVSGNFEDGDGLADGVDDLLLFVRARDLTAAIGEAGNGDIFEIDVTAVLEDGTPVLGSDTVKLKVKKVKERKVKVRKKR